MELQIDLKKLVEHNLTPNEFVFLVFLNENREIYYKLSKEAIDKLVFDSWIRISDNNFILRPKFNSIFNESIKTKEIILDKVVENWIDSWRELFPSGVKSGGRPVRGDKQGVLKKMKKFVKQNPNIPINTIFKATKNYVISKKLDNWNFMTCADYFIEKNNISLLSSFIEDLSESNNYESIEDKGGKFHKEI